MWLEGIDIDDEDECLESHLHWVNGVANTTLNLPKRVCFWKQRNIICKTPMRGLATDCDFHVRDLAFVEILGLAPNLTLVANTNAHEGGVYHPTKNEFYFTSSRKISRSNKDAQNVEVKKLSLTTRMVTIVFPDTDVANGMALDKEGYLLICQQGQGKKPGYIQQMDVNTKDTRIVADNWMGVPFNSPNDIVVKSDGSIWFTDPDYGWYLVKLLKK